MDGTMCMPVRWEGRSGKTGYSPAGIREWDQRPSTDRGQKRTLHHSKLFPLSEEVIRDHLLGKQTIGVYPLLQDDTCWFVAVDFDKKHWQSDALAFLKTCNQTVTMERRYVMGLDSYDRLFPSQDTMPQGGFGNLIALPLQKGAMPSR